MADQVIETASWGRRIGALFVDWFACWGVAEALVATGVIGGNPSGIVTLVLFVAETALLTAFAGGSFGKLATRLRVVRADGGPGPLDPLRSLARSIMVIAVIPPVVFKPDGRGLHDLAVGTATVTLETYRARTGR